MTATISLKRNVCNWFLFDQMVSQNRARSMKYVQSDSSFEVFTAAMFQVKFFCVVTPCSVVVG
jgi:hypothetical protein